MGRRKKVEEMENFEFDEVFGEFRPESAKNEKEPMFKIVQTDETIAQPCGVCGRYPRLHYANFKDKEKYPNPVYIDCPGCHCCDGEWYADKDAALAVWNEKNIGAKPHDPNVKDNYDFCNELCSNIKIPD